MRIFQVSAKFLSDKFLSKSHQSRNKGSMNFFNLDSCVRNNYKMISFMMFLSLMTSFEMINNLEKCNYIRILVIRNNVFWVKQENLNTIDVGIIILLTNWKEVKIYGMTESNTNGRLLTVIAWNNRDGISTMQRWYLSMPVLQWSWV